MPPISVHRFYRGDNYSAAGAPIRFALLAQPQGPLTCRPYQYYRCTSRLNKGDQLCTSRNLPMNKLDELVLTHLVEHVLTPERLQLMLSEARRLLSERKSGDQEKLAKLQAELRTAEERLNRLYEAVESGALSLDETLQRRAQQLKAALESVLVEMAGLRRTQAMPIEPPSPEPGGGA